MAITDLEIESAAQAAGGWWDGDHWCFEDADFHPFVRSVLAAHPATPATLCACKDRLASECEEEWGPKCDLGNNLKHACGGYGLVAARDGRIAEEANLRRAVSVFEDVLGDIADWEDKALENAVRECIRDLQALIEGHSLATQVAGESEDLDAEAEKLIEEADGCWHDDEFRVNGRDLMRLVRAALTQAKQENTND